MSSKIGKVNASVHLVERIDMFAVLESNSCSQRMEPTATGWAFRYTSAGLAEVLSL